MRRALVTLTLVITLTACAAPATPTATAYAMPTVDDYTVTLVEVKQDCFMAACSTTYGVELEQVTATKFDPDAMYELVYQVNSPNEELTNYLLVVGNRWSRNDTGNQFTTTASRNALTIKIIGIVAVND